MHLQGLMPDCSKMIFASTANTDDYYSSGYMPEHSVSVRFAAVDCLSLGGGCNTPLQLTQSCILSQAMCVACCAATLGTNNASRVINQLQLSTESVKALIGEDLTEEELLKANIDGMLDAEYHAGNFMCQMHELCLQCQMPPALNPSVAGAGEACMHPEPPACTQVQALLNKPQ